ncbi:MAG: YlzJ-like family protein [Clostridiales bacterium]|nr:YlzJ-like family protein [Clostridiales bacterium]MDR2712523.1 YlzJ-like family protein [Clostridiales bacterium]
MIWSIIPEETVFAVPEAKGATVQPRLINYQGCQMLVSPQGNGKGQILRLLSGDPKHYLDPRFCPGQEIKL